MRSCWRACRSVRPRPRQRRTPSTEATHSPFVRAAVDDLVLGHVPILSSPAARVLTCEHAAGTRRSPGHRRASWPRCSVCACPSRARAARRAGGARTPVSRLRSRGVSRASFTSPCPGAARSRSAPKGTVFVGTQSGAVYAGGGPRPLTAAADEVSRLAEGARQPNGVAFRQGALYVAEVSRVQRYDAIEIIWRASPARHRASTGFPASTTTDEVHRLRSRRPLYVPVGAPCNVCESADRASRASSASAPTARRGHDGAGVRNTVGFDWEPGAARSGSPTTAATSSGTTSRRTSSTARRSPAATTGFPACHAGTIVDPVFAKGRDCRTFEPPRSRSVRTWPRSGCASIAGACSRGVSRAGLHRRARLLEPQHEDRVPRLARRVKDGQAVSYQPFRAGLAAGRAGVGPARGRPGAARRLAARLRRQGGRDLPHHLRPPLRSACRRARALHASQRTPAA
jgi:hypothetical protein